MSLIRQLLINVRALSDALTGQLKLGPNLAGRILLNRLAEHYGRSPF